MQPLNANSTQGSEPTRRTVPINPQAQPTTERLASSDVRLTNVATLIAELTDALDDSAQLVAEGSMDLPSLAHLEYVRSLQGIARAAVASDRSLCRERLIVVRPSQIRARPPKGGPVPGPDAGSQATSRTRAQDCTNELQTTRTALWAVRMSPFGTTTRPRVPGKVGRHEPEQRKTEHRANPSAITGSCQQAFYFVRDGCRFNLFARPGT